jgi:hypothetical protein
MMGMLLPLGIDGMTATSSASSDRFGAKASIAWSCSNEAQLHRVLKNYASYYNQVCTHLSLDKNAPDFRRPQKLGPIAGLSIQYVRL